MKSTNLTLEEKRAALRPYPDYIDKEAGIQLCNDSYQNWKSHGINEKAQLILSDIPYAIGTDAYGSNPMWYEGGDNANGESKLAGKAFFDTDYTFRVKEFLHFSSQMLKPEPKSNADGKEIGKNGKKSGGGRLVWLSFVPLSNSSSLSKPQGTSGSTTTSTLCFGRITPHKS